MKLAAFMLVILAVPAAWASLAPLAAALPGVCADDCRIGSASFPGYEPVATIIANGASVTWFSTDNTHVQQDTPVGSSQTCFAVGAALGEDSLPVRFDIAGATLTATVDGETTTCRSAIGNAAGGFVVPYFCTIHPTMRGTLVITA